MNWVDYMGQIAVAQGYVSWQKSIRRSGRTQGCIDTGPLRYGRPPPGSGSRSHYSRTPPPHFGLICHLRVDQTAPPFLRFQIFPFSAFLTTCWRRVRRAGFDVLHLSRVFWGTGISGGISTAWNIHEYFGWQLKGLQRVLDCAENVGRRHPRCTIYQHLPVDTCRLYMKYKASLMSRKLRTASEDGWWGEVVWLMVKMILFFSEHFFVLCQLSEKII